MIMCACVDVQAFTTLHFAIRRPGLVYWNERNHCDSKRIKIIIKYSSKFPFFKNATLLTL